MGKVAKRGAKRPVRPSASAMSPPHPAATEDQAKLVDVLLPTLNGVAQRIQALWITFISFGAYLLITVLGTTHRMLLLEDPVTLPVFNVALPLTSFYLMAPGLFLIFHFYLLVQLVLLARTAGQFVETLNRADMTDDQREAIRMRLDNSVFVQLLAGAAPERTGKNRWLILPVAWLTVIILPVGLLVLIQLQFLPYHNGWVTLFQRVILMLDLAVLFVLWPTFSRGAGVISFPVLCAPFRDRASAARAKAYGLIAGVLVLVTFVWLIATFPTELLYSGNGLTKAIFERGVDRVTGRPRGMFSNRIVVPDQTFVDDKLVREMDSVESDLRPGKYRIVRSFRGRDLAFAVLPGADLRRSDFTGANLEGIDLREASLDRSRFGSIDDKDQAKDSDEAEVPAESKAKGRTGRASGTGKRHGVTHLFDAKLNSAQLNHTIFKQAVLTNAILESASLEGASLEDAQLQNSDLSGARMPGANLSRARLVGADLSTADLRFASLREANLRMASLDFVKLHAATLSGAQLQGASMSGVDLIGAVLSSARLQGAELLEVQLQGASLTGVDLDGASIEDSYIWLASVARVTGRIVQPVRDTADEDEPNKDAGVKKGRVWQRPSSVLRRGGDEDIDAEVFASIVEEATDGFASRLKSAVFRARLERLNPKRPVPPAWNTDLRNWEKLLDDRVKGDDAKKLRAKVLKEAACDEEDAPYAVNALLKSRLLDGLGDHKVQIMKDFEAATDCPGAVGADLKLAQEQ